MRTTASSRYETDRTLLNCNDWLEIGFIIRTPYHGIYSLHGMDRSLDSIGTCVTKMQRGFSPISEER